MIYISIDGDDIGRRVVSKHLANDERGLKEFVASVFMAMKQIETILIDAGYTIIFCAADGVVARKSDINSANAADICNSLQHIGGKDLTFSAGIGQSLREAYIALLAAKSNGKAQFCIFSSMISHV